MNLQWGVISVLKSPQLCYSLCWSSVLYSLALGEQKSESYKGKVCQSDQFPRLRERERGETSQSTGLISALPPRRTWWSHACHNASTSSPLLSADEILQLQTWRDRNYSHISPLQICQVDVDLPVHWTASQH